MLDLEGVIRQCTLSSAIAGEETQAWLGRPWVDTVGEAGSAKVQRMVDDARARGVSGFRQITQRFPSGLELPMEFTTVRLGGQGGLLAIGKSLQAVAELQSRLIAAQQAMERDYWKLREVETRYRLLFDASNEAVLLIKATSLRIVEANPAAIRALGLSPVGRDFLPELAAQDREAFQAMLLRVREHGKAPGSLIHLGRDLAPWLIRASLITSDLGPVFLLQLAPVGASPAAFDRSDPVAVEALIERMPDGFVVLDQDGVILHANRAFLKLVEVGGQSSVLGERLRRWLGRPGADLTVLLAHLRRHGTVRLFSTTVHGELGTDTEVEISAAAGGEGEPRHVGVLLRDVGQRLPLASSQQLSAILGSLVQQIGKTPLRSLVRDTGGIVERHYIEAALDLTGGNRTAAAELLGLSRQSLYSKLNRYGLDGPQPGSPDPSD